MDSTIKKVRALGLCSGGLDSILSALVLIEQGIDVTWVSFETPFFTADKARNASRNTGVPLMVEDITQIYLEMLKDPDCGYGRNMNPCMDCHALMFNMAGKIMREQGFHFLFSGEVMGQRPMSQTRQSLRYVEKHSGHDGLILRPLSARLLPETLPEQRGWVDRSRLCDISGRGRKPQMEMAERFGITDYPNPAGGCLLTDKNYSRRLKDLFDRQPLHRIRDFHLLKFGRHFRIGDSGKIIVGRDRHDNAAIVRRYDRERDFLVKVKQYAGPMVLVPDATTRDILMPAAGIAAGYTKMPPGTRARAMILTPEGRAEMEISPVSAMERRQFMI